MFSSVDLFWCGEQCVCRIPRILVALKLFCRKRSKKPVMACSHQCTVFCYSLSLCCSEVVNDHLRGVQSCVLSAICEIISFCSTSGGFLEFQATHPSLCESKTTAVMSSKGNYKCPPLTSMSQPCLPVSNIGPTKILPFLFLGSQHDALSRDSMQVRTAIR